MSCLLAAHQRAEWWIWLGSTKPTVCHRAELSGWLSCHGWTRWNWICCRLVV